MSGREGTRLAERKRNRERQEAIACHEMFAKAHASKCDDWTHIYVSLFCCATECLTEIHTKRSTSRAQTAAAKWLL